MEQTTNPESITNHQAGRLVKWVGVIFFTLAITDFLTSPSSETNFFVLLIYISTGAGMFGKQAWSRILGMIVSVFNILASSILFLSYLSREHIRAITSPLSPQLTQTMFILLIVLFGLILYVLFRPDVKELFKSRSE